VYHRTAGLANVTHFARNEKTTTIGPKPPHFAAADGLAGRLAGGPVQPVCHQVPIS
jgi:hypothetical protein